MRAPAPILPSNYALTEMMIFPFWRWPATMKKMLTRDKALISQEKKKTPSDSAAVRHALCNADLIEIGGGIF